MNEGTEYRVWTETADLIYAGPDRSEAAREMAAAIAEHIVHAECDGCGVLTPSEEHGIHIQICDGDNDVTGDPTYH